MDSKFIKSFVSDSQDARSELEELKDRYIWSFERRDGMSFDDYAASRMPKHPYDGVNDEGERKYEPVQQFIKRMTAEERAERIKKLDEEYRMETFGPIDKEKTLGDMLAKALEEKEELLYDYQADFDEMMPQDDEDEDDWAYFDKSPEMSTQEVAEMEEDAIQKAVDPGHYKGVAGGKQYIELMAEMLDDPQSHLMGQTYKYMMRLGKKDAPEQDAKKAAFYLMCLVQFLRDGDIDANKVQEALKQL